MTTELGRGYQPIGIDYAATNAVLGRRQQVVTEFGQLPTSVRYAVIAYAKRLTKVASIPRPIPIERTRVAQAAHVICLGWNNPDAVARWVRETNIFWLNVDQYDEPGAQTSTEN